MNKVAGHKSKGTGSGGGIGGYHGRPSQFK